MKIKSAQRELKARVDGTVGDVMQRKSDIPITLESAFLGVLHQLLLGFCQTLSFDQQYNLESFSVCSLSLNKQSSPQSAFLNVPHELLFKIVKFCHHFSLVQLCRTNQQFRTIALREIRTRFEGLNLEKKSHIQSPAAIFNVWLALTSSSACTFCGECKFDGTSDCKNHPFFRAVICKACFMERLHVDRPILHEKDIDGTAMITVNGKISWLSSSTFVATLIHLYKET